MIAETYMSELNENILIYGLIPFLKKTINRANKLHLITPELKLKFNLKEDRYENKIELKLGKVHTKTSFSTPRDNVLNFGVLGTKRNKPIAEKRAMSYKIVDTVQILGLQNFDDYGCLNPVERTIDSNKVIKMLSNYKKYKFRIIIWS